MNLKEVYYLRLAARRQGHGFTKLSAILSPCQTIYTTQFSIVIGPYTDMQLSHVSSVIG